MSAKLRPYGDQSKQTKKNKLRKNKRTNIPTNVYSPYGRRHESKKYKIKNNKGKKQKRQEDRDNTLRALIAP